MHGRDKDVADWLLHSECREPDFFRASILGGWVAELWPDPGLSAAG